MKEKTKPNLVKCPYCGSTPVMGTLVTTYSYVSEHCLRENGIDIEDKSNRIGAMLGDMSIEPMMRITKYKCLSCQKEWGTYGKKEYIFVGNENGLCYFEKREKK